MGQWVDNPSVNLQITSTVHEKATPKISLCPNGDYYVGFFSKEEGNYNVRLQRMDNNGNILWPENGILISSHPSMTWITDWDMKADNENHAILTWQDIRSGGNNNVVAYRISPNGEFVWGADGIMLSDNNAFDVSPKVVVTSVNNVVFAWQSNNSIITQKLSPQGVKIWGENGITHATFNRLTWPQLLPVGEDDVIMKFFEDSGPSWAPTRHILAQRFNANGQSAWNSTTVVYNSGSINAWYQILPFINDGNDGFYIAFYDYRNSGTIASAWVHHIGTDGQPVFPANGVLLSTRNSFHQFSPQLAKTENSDEIYVYWREVNGNQTQWGIYGQKVSANGQRMWGDEGKTIVPVSSSTAEPFYATNIQNDVVVFYAANGLLATRLDSNGDFVWEQQSVLISGQNLPKISSLSVSSIAINRQKNVVSDFDNLQWVLAWTENRNSQLDVFAQNLLSNGTLGLPSGTGFVRGSISVEGNMIPFHELQIQIDTLQIIANESGIFEVELPIGIYSITVEHPFAVPFTLSEINVVVNTPTEIEVNIVMKRRDVQYYAIDEWSSLLSGVTFNITGPEGNYEVETTEQPETISNLPYGRYFATGTLWNGLTIEYDSVINDSIGTIVLQFTVGGIDAENVIGEISISPNPVKSNSVVTFSCSLGGNYFCSIVNLQGKYIVQKSALVLRSGLTEMPLNQITPSTLIPGVYLLSVSNGRDAKVVKFVVE
jgi:hypothetical protein